MVVTLYILFHSNFWIFDENLKTENIQPANKHTRPEVYQTGFYNSRKTTLVYFQWASLLSCVALGRQQQIYTLSIYDIQWMVLRLGEIGKAPEN